MILTKEDYNYYFVLENIKKLSSEERMNRARLYLKLKNSKVIYTTSFDFKLYYDYMA